MPMRGIAAMFAHSTPIPFSLALGHPRSDFGRMNELADIETRFGPLPSDYRRWLDGGMVLPDDNFFWVQKDDWGSTPETMYGIDGDTSLLSMNTEQRSDYIPQDLILVGDDGIAGTWIALGVAGMRRGKVFFIDANGAEYDKPLPNSAIIEIAPSFTAWLTTMEAPPDE